MGLAAWAIALLTGGPGVITPGELASVLVALVSDGHSPVFFRFALFGLGLPFVSCIKKNVRCPHREKEYTHRNAESH